MNFLKPTLKEVKQALAEAAKIPRPYGDNEGEALNAPSVYEHLSPQQKEVVDHAVEVCREYLIEIDGELNRRSITYLNRSGYPTYLGPSQDDPYRTVGNVETGGQKLDVGDPPPFQHD